jgi:hypothetical protein
MELFCLAKAFGIRALEVYHTVPDCSIASIANDNTLQAMQPGSYIAADVSTC